MTTRRVQVPLGRRHPHGQDHHRLQRPQGQGQVVPDHHHDQLLTDEVPCGRQEGGGVT
ncbi:hypothetical protein QJS66_02535 [Kocuria rhizophila]|nr:hypothetical protein QJS66_02535 [Kocuria rhizophila]